MADVKINQQQWDALSQAERETITKGLRGTGALKIGDSIVGDPSVPQFDENTQLEPMWNPLKGVCKAACDVAAATGAAWCTANTLGVGLVACLAAAEAARQLCRDRC
jgi:hypothetical protein